MPILRKYGYRKDHPNLMRPLYGAIIQPNLQIALPPKVDITTLCPPNYNQGNTSSCTAHATAFGVEFLEKKGTPSRLGIYYNARIVDGDPQVDHGSSISSCIYAIKNQGVAAETLWQFDENKVLVQPDPSFYDAAKADLLLQDLSIQSLFEIKHCLASGFPVLFGFQVYDYFESEEMAASPILNIPQPNENYVGGHAVAYIGYDDSTNMLKVRNSWGEDWGDKGNFYMSYAYASDPNLTSDFWSIQKMTEQPQ